MRRCIFSLVLLFAPVTCLTGVGQAQTGSWIFRPSYYSHDPVIDVHIGPRFDGGPYFVHPQGSYIRSGYRQLQTVVPTAGNGTDTTNSFDSWIQIGGQY